MFFLTGKLKTGRLQWGFFKKVSSQQYHQGLGFSPSFCAANFSVRFSSKLAARWLYHFHASYPDTIPRSKGLLFHGEEIFWWTPPSPFVSLARIISHVHVQTCWLGSWGLISDLDQLGYTHPKPGAKIGLPWITGFPEKSE